MLALWRSFGTPFDMPGAEAQARCGNVECSALTLQECHRSPKAHNRVPYMKAHLSTLHRWLESRSSLRLWAFTSCSTTT